MPEEKPVCKKCDWGSVWILNSKIHREDGPAIEHINGYKEYRTKGIVHREDGPAKQFSDSHLEWYINGRLHREDGPAVEYNNGQKEWFLNDIIYQKKDYFKELEKIRSKDWVNKIRLIYA